MLAPADATQFTINSMGGNPTRTWHKYVMLDPGLFHGTLSIVALYMHNHIGITIVKEDLFFHRGEAMKIISKQLHNINRVDISMLIGTIATMLSFEVLNFFSYYSTTC
jgi:hypothetical protein